MGKENAPRLTNSIIFVKTVVIMGNDIDNSMKIYPL